MNYPLPPKKFQRFDDPRFDPIRNRNWTKVFIRRSGTITKLARAYYAWQEQGISQRQAATNFGVPYRELSEFSSFISGKGKEVYKTFQTAIDDAYLNYCNEEAKRHFVTVLREAHVEYFSSGSTKELVRMWEMHPHFWPTGYKLTV